MYTFLLFLMSSICASSTHIVMKDGQAVPISRALSEVSSLPLYSDQVHVYFSPDDNVKNHLIKAINTECSYIKIAIFTFTDKQIADALLDAHRRGVFVEIVTDPVCLKDRFNKINLLIRQGVNVYVYSTDGGSGLYSTMHHKFAIFGKNHENRRYVWVGSFNFTKSANESNQESVVVIHQCDTIEQFERQFAKLKLRSQRLVFS